MPKQSKKLDLQIDENMVKSTEGIEYSNTPAKSGPFMTFDHWFAVSGRKKHHKAALKVFTNTSGKRTKDDWDLAFKSY